MALKVEKKLVSCHFFSLTRYYLRTKLKENRYLLPIIMIIRIIRKFFLGDMYMKKIKISLLLLWIMIFNSGCMMMVQMKKDPLPEETIEAFEDAINDMDVDAMMACIDSKAVKAMTTGMDLLMKVAGGITGVSIPVSTQDLLDLMPLMQGINDAYGQMEYPQVDLQVTETYIKGDKATVYFTEVNSGEPAVINMELQDGTWVMTMDTKLIQPEDAERVIIAGQEEAGGDPDTAQMEDLDGTLEFTGNLNLKEAAENFSVLDLFSQEKIEELLRAVLIPEK